MDPPDLLNSLCTIRRIAFALVGSDLRIRSLGGVRDPWPELQAGDLLTAALPELHGREAELKARLEAGKRYVLRWVPRPSRGRQRYYEVVLHPHPTDRELAVCWVCDRTSYGRLKARIDQYYSELIADGPTDATTLSSTESVP